MSGNTMRGTPSRGADRGRIPTFNHSPAPGAGAGPGASSGSGIPRPVLGGGDFGHKESYATNSEIGGASTVSTSRQKQSKRDEVSSLCIALHIVQLVMPGSPQHAPWSPPGGSTSHIAHRTSQPCLLNAPQASRSSYLRRLLRRFPSTTRLAKSSRRHV